ncbi:MULTISPECIES: hypothetical protein [Amycolatopsis]|uniref:Uncharacterized protein n=1 Tax=Amycolatopsis nalaikhensis TaxID=715472 RepID=A0ABY8Y036_9PSEU|nr:hypothetical protein [Amycolatopsis sp. 2-2]WIV61243.1 hypothetical protein QP939_22895 [Amycolatopsis sp. 2-2]
MPAAMANAPSWAAIVATSRSSVPPIPAPVSSSPSGVEPSARRTADQSASVIRPDRCSRVPSPGAPELSTASSRRWSTPPGRPAR